MKKTEIYIIPTHLPPEPPPEQPDPNETITSKKPVKEPDKPIPECFRT